MSFAAWFRKPNLMQAAEAQYPRAVPPLMNSDGEQTIGTSGISAKVLPAIGDAVPARLQVSAPGTIIGQSESGTVYVTSTGSEHIVEHAIPEGGIRELQGDERIVALSGITAAVWQARRQQRNSHQ